jgi:putative SOS response-associated peptidase YedK
MCNLYSITTNQEAIRVLFRVVNRYVGNLAPVPGVFPDYPAPVIRNSGDERELNVFQRTRQLTDRLKTDGAETLYILPRSVQTVR